MAGTKTTALVSAHNQTEAIMETVKSFTKLALVILAGYISLHTTPVMANVDCDGAVYLEGSELRLVCADLCAHEGVLFAASECYLDCNRGVDATKMGWLRQCKREAEWCREDDECSSFELIGPSGARYTIYD